MITSKHANTSKTKRKIEENGLEKKTLLVEESNTLYFLRF